MIKGTKKVWKKRDGGGEVKVIKSEKERNKEISNAVFHWQIFSSFFVYMSKNRKKLFHWANIPDGVKPESSF